MTGMVATDGAMKPPTSIPVDQRAKDLVIVL